MQSILHLIGVTGSKPEQGGVFKIFRHINRRELRKNQYNYDNNFPRQQKNLQQFGKNNNIF